MAHILEGKTIDGIEIAEDKQALRFLIRGEEPIIAKCDGDCCSSTWVENVELPVNGFPATVITAQNVDMPDQGDMEGRDVVSYYGFKIHTDKGEILIDYRNESNGYYGGSLEWPGEYFYGGVFSQNVSNEKWQPVVDGAK